jgi:hypothetical protein
LNKAAQHGRSRFAAPLAALLLLVILIVVGVQFVPAPVPSPEMEERARAAMEYYDKLGARLRAGDTAALGELADRMDLRSNNSRL